MSDEIERKSSQSKLEEMLRSLLKMQFDYFFEDIVLTADFLKLKSISKDFDEILNRYRASKTPIHSGIYSGTLPEDVYISSPTFADFLRNAMKCTLTRSKYDLARTSGVTAPAINNYLTGKRSNIRDPRSAECIKKLCDALGADYRKIVEKYGTPRGEENE